MGNSIGAVAVFLIVTLHAFLGFASGFTHASEVEKSRDPVIITYVANEGVLISSGDKQVLIDAIHKPYSPQYLSTDPKILQAMFERQSPFQSVDVMLVSHIHGDHFHAESVAKFLAMNREAVLFSTPQVVDSVGQYFSGGKKFASQLRRGRYEKGEKSKYETNGVVIELAKVAHGSPQRWGWIQNAAHVISIGGLRLLHIGDPAFGEEDFKALRLQDEKIDVGILPVWFLTSKQGRLLISEEIKPKHIIAVHVSPVDTLETKEKVHSFFPQATLFTKPMQALKF